MVRAALFLVCSVAGVEGGGEDGYEEEDAVLYLLEICCCIPVADPWEMLDTTVTSLKPMIRGWPISFAGEAAPIPSMDQDYLGTIDLSAITQSGRNHLHIAQRQ